MRKLARGSMYLTLASIVSNLTGYLYWIIVSYLTNPETLGYVSVTMTIASMANSVILLGIQRGMARILPELRVRDPIAYRSTIFSLMIFELILAIAAAFAVLIIYRVPEAVYAAALIILNAIGMMAAVLNIEMRQRDIFIIRLVSDVVKCVTGISLVIAGYGVIGVLWGYIARSVVAASMTVLLLVKNSLLYPKPNFRGVLNIIRVGIAFYIPGLITSITQQAGLIAVFVSQGATETGTYYVATMLANVVTMFPMTLAMLSLIVASSKGVDSGATVIERVVKVGASLATLIALGGYIVTKPLLKLLGESYLSSAPVAYLLFISAPIMVFNTSSFNMLLLEMRLGIVFACALTGAVTRLIIYVLSIPVLGGLGAAVANLTAAAIVTMIMKFIVSRRVEKLRYVLRDRHMIMTIAPLILAYALAEEGFEFLNAPLALAVMILYLKTKEITPREVKLIVTSLTPQPLREPVINVMKRVYFVMKPFIEE